MATWIWRWRRTMLGKARWTARTESRRFAKRAITCRKCRMLISGQARVAWKACGSIRERFARTWTPTAERFSPTIESVRGGDCPKQELGRKAGMLAGQIFLHRAFARVSPVFLVAGLALSCAHFSLAAEASDSRNKSNKRDAASTQCARAEYLRAELNSKAAEKRRLSEYKRVVSSYRRVYLITPHAAEVPDALLAVAELYSEMGDRFGRSYYQLATDSYRFLLHEYPTSHFGQDAMLRMARLQKDQLGDAAGASKTFEEFVKKYPRSSRKREAQESLAELALLRNSEESPAAKSEPTAPDAEKSAAAAESARRVPADAVPVYAENSDKVPRLRRIGTSASSD